MKTKVVLQDFFSYDISGDFQDGINKSAFASLVKSPNYCALDGDGISLNENLPFFTKNAPCGFVSTTISGSDGTFSTPPQIALIFNTKISVNRFALSFFGNYCKKFGVEFYDGKKFLGNSYYSDIKNMTAEYTPNFDVKNCDKIIFYFHETQKPEQFARVESISINSGDSDTEYELYTSLKTAHEIDIAALDAPIGTVDFTGISTNGLPDEKKIHLTPMFRGIGKMSDFTIKSITPESPRKFTILGEDTLGILDSTTFDGGIYSSIRAIEIVDKITDASGVKIDTSDLSEELKVSGYIPICTARKALLLVAFATNTIIRVDFNGTIYLSSRNSDETPQYTIYGGDAKNHKGASNRIIGNAVYEKSEPYTDVELYSYVYSLPKASVVTLYSSDSEEVKELRVEFENPIINTAKYPLSLTGTNKEIVEANANYAIISGKGLTLTGFEYSVNKLVSKSNVPQNIASSGNTLSCQNFTLSASESNGGITVSKKTILENLIKYAKSKGRVRAKIIVTIDETTGAPLEKVGDYIEIETPYNGFVRGYITRAEYNISQNLTANIEVTEWQ